MVRAQVLLLCLVALGAQVASVTLVVEFDVGFGQVVVFHVEEALRTHVSHIEVTRLDRMNEVLVRWLEGIVWVHLWELSLIGRNEAVGVAPAKLHRRLLGLHLANRLFLALPAASPPRN